MAFRDLEWTVKTCLLALQGAGELPATDASGLNAAQVAMHGLQFVELVVYVLPPERVGGFVFRRRSRPSCYFHSLDAPTPNHTGTTHSNFTQAPVSIHGCCSMACK